MTVVEFKPVPLLTGRKSLDTFWRLLDPPLRVSSVDSFDIRFSFASPARMANLVSTKQPLIILSIGRSGVKGAFGDGRQEKAAVRVGRPFAGSLQCGGRVSVD